MARPHPSWPPSATGCSKLASPPGTRMPPPPCQRTGPTSNLVRPPRHGTTACADPEASWGHRNSNLPGPRGELFFGYYLSAATMTREEAGPDVPELRVSQIEHGRITELDAVRAYIEALGGTVDVLARVGDWTVKVA
jgi:hypothetical protein